jgi:hypothetical protein
MARGVKDERYSEESQDLDLEQFNVKFESCLEGLEDPRVVDNVTYSFASIIGTTLCAG